MTKYTFEDGYVEVDAGNGNIRDMLEKTLVVETEAEILKSLKSGPFLVTELAEKMNYPHEDLTEILFCLERAKKVKIRQQMVASC